MQFENVYIRMMEYSGHVEKRDFKIKAVILWEEDAILFDKVLMLRKIENM